MIFSSLQRQENIAQTPQTKTATAPADKQLAGQRLTEPRIQTPLLRTMHAPNTLNFLGEGEPTNVTNGRIPPKETKIFSTGDPWVVLHRNPRDKAVHVTLSEDTSGPWDYETRLIEALQTCWAAQENGAQSISLHLPEHLNPDNSPNPINNLIPTLAHTLGVTRLTYTAQPSTSTNNNTEQNNLFSDKKATDKQRRRYINPPIPRHVVFSGSANPSLGQNVARALDQQGNTVEFAPHHYIREGANTQVTFEADLRDCDVTITLSTRPSPDATDSKSYNSAAQYLLESLLLADAAKNAGAKSVQLAMAYQPSARSDKRETVDPNYAGAYGAMVARFCDGMDIIKRVALLETHDRHTDSFFSNTHCQSICVSGLLSLAERFIAEGSAENTVLVAPDDGAVKRTKLLADALNLPMISAHKSRAGHGDDNATVGALNSGQALDPSKQYFLTDDETATGGTLRQVLTQLREQGAKHITAAIAHNNMPLDKWERHLCLAALMQAGAEKVQFLDTQPMGQLVSSVEEFDQLALESGKTHEDLRNWLSKKVFKKDGVTDAEIEDFKQNFTSLGSEKVEVISAAPLLATALAPPATIEQRVNQLAEKAITAGATKLAATTPIDAGIVAAAAQRINIPWIFVDPNNRPAQLMSNLGDIAQNNLPTDPDMLNTNDVILIAGPTTTDSLKIKAQFQPYQCRALLLADHITNYTQARLPEPHYQKPTPATRHILQQQAANIIKTLTASDPNGSHLTSNNQSSKNHITPLLQRLSNHPEAAGVIHRAMASKIYDLVQEARSSTIQPEAKFTAEQPIKLLSNNATGLSLSIPLSLHLSEWGIPCDIVPIETQSKRETTRADGAQSVLHMNSNDEGYATRAIKKPRSITEKPIPTELPLSPSLDDRKSKTIDIMLPENSINVNDTCFLIDDLYNDALSKATQATVEREGARLLITVALKGQPAQNDRQANRINPNFIGQIFNFSRPDNKHRGTDQVWCLSDSPT